ncbi:MAG: hypothetical protein Q4G22_00385 [Paracoccus sp. (in: a-proteobacteria)]|uniref:hypothetical protein n=1 Tax=Paracoccus sp. TaxID=267 RepID=UPI0026E0D984|nr:hypothetical protein [Paracoccus sp. (in: a-proteobacteria)]MDO5630274.1 hypothetical protein [Paracoccus sp. (in: a-proteobacteria)]
MPKLVRLYITHVLIGFAIAIAFTALLIGLNVANLQHLVLNVRGGWLAVILLIVFNTIVFGGVQFAIAVMRMAEPETPPRGGLRQHLFIRPALIRAKVESKHTARRS